MGADEETTQGLSLEQELDVRVAEARGRMSRNDERILGFIRDHQDELAFHTAESLAQGAGVSAAAVVRFARRLGFPSFRDLRERARDELQAGVVSMDGAGPAAPQPAETPLGRKVRRDIASLELLPRLLEEPLADAARALARAPVVWLLANRETYGLTVYAQRLMHQVRGDVRLVDPSYPDGLRDADPSHVVLACTFRPYARQTLALMAHARARGVRVVVLTDGQRHDFIDGADVVLALPVESPTMFLSFTPAVCVLEALAAQVAMLDVDRTHDTLEATAQFVGEQGLMVERPSVRVPGSPRRRG